MVSPLALINSSRRPPVVMYAPGRAQAFSRPAPTRRTNAPRTRTQSRSRERQQRGTVDWDRVENAFSNTTEAQQRRQEELQPKEEVPWWRQGLGILINNPVTRTALMPLNELDKGRRAVVLAASEIAQAVPDPVQRAFSGLPGVGALNLIDEQRVEEDPRSNWEKINDPTYGFGQIAHQTDNQWINRAVGLGGDIALDPLTYLTMGTARAATGGARAGAIPAGRGARMTELARLADQPEALQRLAPDIARAGQRGLGTASPALRQALNITEPQLRFMGAGIPGSQVVARPAAEAFGAAKVAAQRIPGVEFLSRGPKGLEAATRVLTRGSDEMSVPRAVTNVAMSDAYRRGEGSMLARGNARLRQFVQQDLGRNKARRGMTDDAVRELVREAEKPGGQNAVNRLFADLAETYQQVSGKQIGDYLRDPETYFPHQLTRSFRRMLRKQLDKGDPVAEQFMERMGFYTDDLLEGSSHLEKARVLTPNADGTPRELSIGGRDIVIQSGNLDEINDELRKVFPGFSGKFYEDDPVIVAESYIASIARQAGRDAAVGRVAATANPLVQRIEGDLERALAERNDALANRVPLVQDIQQGYTPGEAVRDLPEPAEIPEGVGDDIFKSREQVGATKQRNQKVIKQGKKYLGALRQDVAETRKRVVQTLAETRRSLAGDLRDVVKANDPKIKALNQRIEGYSARINEIGPLRAENADTAVALATAIRQDIVDLQAEIVAIKRAGATRARRADKKVMANLESGLRTLRGLRDQVQQDIIQKGPKAMRDEIEFRLRQLMKPVEDAQHALDAKIASIPGRPSDDRIAFARRVLAGRQAENQFVEERATRIQQLRDEIEQLRGDPRRSRGGQPSANTQRLIDEKQADIDRIERMLPGTSKPGHADRTVAAAHKVMRQLDDWEQRKIRETAAETAALNQAKARVAQHQEAVVRDMRTGERIFDESGYPYRQVTPEPTEEERLADVFPSAQGRIENAAGQLGELEFLSKAVSPENVNRRLREIDERIRELRAMGSSDRAVEREIDRLAEERRITLLVGRETQKRLPGKSRRLSNEMRRASDERAANELLGAQPRPPRPRTEAEAIEALRTAARNSPMPKRLNELNQQIAEREAVLADLQAGARSDEAMRVQDEVDDLVRQKGEMIDNIEKIFRPEVSARREEVRKLDAEHFDLQYHLMYEQANKDALVAQRNVANKLLEDLPKVNKNKRAEELIPVLDDIAKVAAANPQATDEALVQTESLLQTARRDLERLAKADIRDQDVQRIVDAAYNNKLAKVMITVVNDNWKMLHTGPLAPGDIIVDRQLYNQFQNLFELAKQPTLFGRTFNALTNLFKTYATLSPGFHVRNALSAIFMNTSDGVGLRYQLAGARMWNEYMKEGDDFLRKQSPEVQAAFQAAMGSGAGGRFTEQGVAQAGTNPVYSALASNRVTRFSQRQGERVEGAVRLGMALDSIAKGDSIEQALARITRVHFDYTQVSRLDEQAKRVIPFWTFMSRNLPLQISQMWTKPRLYAWYQSAVRNFSVEPEPYTPDYWNEAGAFNTGLFVPRAPLGGAQGLPIYASPDLGFTRLQQDIANIGDAATLRDPGALLSNVNPWLTAPLELMTKQDFFTGQQFDETDYSEVGGITGAVVNPLAALLGQRNEAGQVSDAFMNSIRSVNPLVDRTARLAPQVTGGDEEDRKRQLESLARFLGLPVRTLTPQQQKNEYFRRYYDLLDEQDRQQAMAGG